MKDNLIEYCLRLADNSLIIGQRLSEWCGHGPVLEEDIALTNIALDHIGQCRSLYQYVGELQGKGETEDDLAFLRDVWDFRNVILVEQPNGDFAMTIARQFFLDTFNFYLLKELVKSSDDRIQAYAIKSLKEVTYHMKHSSDWVIRLGDGTAESHEKMQHAITALYPYAGEMLTPDELDQTMAKAGIGADLNEVQNLWMAKVQEVIEEATLTLPENAFVHHGGKKGIHSEHLGFILSDMQWLQRAYPGNEW